MGKRVEEEEEKEEEEKEVPGALGILGGEMLVSLLVGDTVRLDVTRGAAFKKLGFSRNTS